MKKMEVWDLYTAAREKTGAVIARGQAIPQGFYHLSVSVWIVSRAGQFLLSQRHPDKTYPLRWECTGGCALAGETSLEAAVREVQEELGLSLDPREGRCIRQQRRDAQQDLYDVWLFRRDVPLERLTLQPSEVVDARWVSFPELLSLWRAGRLHPYLDDLDSLEQFL